VTQVTLDSGRNRDLKLPAFLGIDAYVPIPGFVEWWDRMQGRYRWCGTCRVARLADHHQAHMLIHHRDWKGWSGGSYEVPA